MRSQEARMVLRPLVAIVIIAFCIYRLYLDATQPDSETSTSFGISYLVVPFLMVWWKGAGGMVRWTIASLMLLLLEGHWIVGWLPGATVAFNLIGNALVDARERGGQVEPVGEAALRALVNGRPTPDSIRVLASGWFDAQKVRTFSLLTLRGPRWAQSVGNNTVSAYADAFKAAMYALAAGESALCHKSLGDAVQVVRRVEDRDLRELFSHHLGLLRGLAMVAKEPDRPAVTKALDELNATKGGLETPEWNHFTSVLQLLSGNGDRARQSLDAGRHGVRALGDLAQKASKSGLQLDLDVEAHFENLYTTTARIITETK